MKNSPLLTIYEDPTEVSSLFVERLIVRLETHYPDITLHRIFNHHTSNDSWLIHGIKQVQAACPQGVFRLVHHLKEEMHYRKNRITWEDLEDCVFGMGLNLQYKEGDWDSGFSRVPILHLENRDGVVIDTSSNQEFFAKIESFKKLSPLTEENLVALFKRNERLTWDELLFVYQEQKEALPSLIKHLSIGKVLKLGRLGSTILIKTPAKTYCCEGNECDC